MFEKGKKLKQWGFALRSSAKWFKRKALGATLWTKYVALNTVKMKNMFQSKLLTQRLWNLQNLKEMLGSSTSFKHLWGPRPRSCVALPKFCPFLVPKIWSRKDHPSRKPPQKSRKVRWKLGFLSNTRPTYNYPEKGPCWKGMNHLRNHPVW